MAQQTGLVPRDPALDQTRPVRSRHTRGVSEGERDTEPLDVVRAAEADLLPTAVVVIDQDGRIVDGNGRFEEWLGVPLPSAAGQPLDAFVQSNGRAGLARLRDRAVLVARTETPEGVIVAMMDAD